jgi:hypothetical protein
VSKQKYSIFAFYLRLPMKINQYFITNDGSISIDDANFSVNTIYDFKIYSHKKLKVNSFEKGNTELILLGDAFDPFQPEFSNTHIGKALIEHSALSGLLKAVDKLTGRFVLFVKIQGKHYILSDFFGQRQVYYWFNENHFYASSSDKLLLETLGLGMQLDGEKLALSTSNYFLKIHEHWLLGESDWDDRVTKLLPNYFLNIDKAEEERIPVFVTKVEDKAELEKQLLGLLKNSVQAFAKRYELMIGLTSGYDSRLLLASSISLKNDIKYFTFNRNDTYIQRDVRIANQLAEAFNLNYQTIDTEALTQEFTEYFKDQFLVPRLLDKTKNIQWFKNQDHANVANISGFGGELIRGFYKSEDFNTSKSICNAIEYESNNFNLNALDAWLSSAKAFTVQNDLLLSDLFYLEVRLGKWGNKMVHEMDISGVEEFSPYNNRYLMFSILLNYNAVERKTITLNLLQQSVEGITKLPFNPKTWKDRVKKVIFYEFYKKQIQKIK